MKHYKVKSYARQAGMTLIELSVVLLILVGLAGLLIPYVGSFVQKTHDSTTSANFGMLNNAFSRFVVEKNRMPHHVESLTNGTAGLAANGATGACDGAIADAVYCGLFNPALFEAVNWSSTSGATQIESLNKAGLSMMVKNNPNLASKTFGLANGMVYTNTSTANFYVAKVAAGTDTGTTTLTGHLQKALGGAGMDYNTTCYDYIAVGLGDNVELAGNTLTGGSPIGFPESGDQGPSYGYGHYIAILQVDKANTGTHTMGTLTPVPCSPITEKAKFIGTVLNVPTTVAGHLIGINETLTKAHDNMVETKKIE